MICLTGDTHGRFDRIAPAVRQYGLGGEDTLIILGDAGFNYDGNLLGDAEKKAAVNGLGVTVLCIHGNHEMRPATLGTYREKQWRGGAVWYEPEWPNLLFAKDGEVYDIEGRRFLVLGGAYSVDWLYRFMRNPYDPKWWKDEQPDEVIKAHAARTLERVGWRVDVVLSHTCPEKYAPVEAYLPGLDQSRVDRSTEKWLDGIEGRLDYRLWYCGHWHIEKSVDRLRFLYRSVQPLEKMD